MNPKRIGQLIIIVLIASGAYYFYARVQGAATVNVTPHDPLTDGLTGHWTFDGPDISTTTSPVVLDVADVSGKGNDVTTGKTFPTVGKVGQALNYERSVQSWARTSASLSNLITPSEGTISVWARPTSVAPSVSGVENGYAVLGASQVTYLDDWSMGINQSNVSGQDKIWIWNYSTTPSFDSVGVDYTVGEWIHLTWVHSGGTLYAYKNGVLVGQTPSGDTTFTGGVLKIGYGAMHAYPDAYWQGDIDDVRTYNRALSSDEVRQLYNLGAAKFNVTPRDPLTEGLTGHWTFDGPDMTNNVADVSGNGRNGYLVNFTSTTTAIGKVGQALSFDGADDYINSGALYTNFITNSEGTISAWIRPRGTAPTISTVQMYNGDSAVSSLSVFTAFGIARANNTDYGGDMIWAYNSVLGGNNAAGVSYTPNEWTHIVWRHSGGVLSVYKNGEFASSTSSGTTYNWAAPGNLTIGTHWNSSPSNGYWQGDIDDVRTYNRALSADEIRQLYNLGR